MDESSVLDPHMKQQENRLSLRDAASAAQTDETRKLKPDTRYVYGFVGSGGVYQQAINRFRPRPRTLMSEQNFHSVC